MRIPLTIPSSSSSSDPLPPPLIKLGTSLFLLELQGSLEVSGTPQGDEGGLVGEFTMGDKPTLTIGHHLLEGKIVTLPKPLAVLRKRAINRATGDGDVPMADADADAEERDGQSGTSYEIVEIVRKKVVFLRRPALVMGGASSGGAAKAPGVGIGKKR